MRIKNHSYSPLVLPIIFFGALIIIGAVLLFSTESDSAKPLSWTDAFFTATSATCVTGLIVVDTGTDFTRFGQIIILILIQIGGIGIMTFASLAFYLWRQRVSFTDRIAVGQSLLHDPSFHLGKFLIRLIVWTFLIEFLGAAFLFVHAPKMFSPFYAFFHAVSAFCNAGFSLFPNSLIDWQGEWVINIIFIILIFLGGIGFSVLVELQTYCTQLIKPARNKLSWHSKTVLQTSIFMVVFGGVAIYLAEFVGYHRMMVVDDAALTSLFQSVTCRTAGFNTLDISKMTNVSLVVMLMFVGRLGPLLFVAAVQSLQKTQYYVLPEENLMIG
jgi:trk system potassium uptake protein TrkH